MAAPLVVYAIGDVHGEADRLNKLHQLIAKRHDAAHQGIRARIIHLGDYIDRGPDSCGAIETLIALEKDARVDVVNLRGNHEQMLLDVIASDNRRAVDGWLQNGGEQTLASYGSRGWSTPPQQHLLWMRGLPLLHIEADKRLIFVHAGVDVDAYPHCGDHVRLWTRSPAFFASDTWSNPALEGWTVVHGHTPTQDYFPELDGAKPRRVNLDTGAVFGGRLTAAEFADGAPVRFLYA